MYPHNADGLLRRRIHERALLRNAIMVTSRSSEVVYPHDAYGPLPRLHYTKHRRAARCAISAGVALTSSLLVIKLYMRQTTTRARAFAAWHERRRPATRIPLRASTTWAAGLATCSDGARVRPHRGYLLFYILTLRQIDTDIRYSAVESRGSTCARCSSPRRWTRSRNAGTSGR